MRPGLLHEAQRTRQVAEEQLEPAAVVHRGGGEVGEAEGHGVLVRPPQPDVAVVVATEELVGQAEVEVEQAAGPRGDLRRVMRDALEQLAGALPLADPAVQARRAGRRRGSARGRAGAGEEPVGDVEEGEGAVPVAPLDPRHARGSRAPARAATAASSGAVDSRVQPAQRPTQQRLGARRRTRGVGEDGFLDEAGDVVVQVGADPGLRSPRSA